MEKRRMINREKEMEKLYRKREKLVCIYYNIFDVLLSNFISSAFFIRE